MDKEYYRQVPYRFFNHESNTDACRLEKLTNLFPDMKAAIELGTSILSIIDFKNTTYPAFLFPLKNYLKLTIYRVLSIDFHVYIQF